MTKREAALKRKLNTFTLNGETKREAALKRKFWTFRLNGERMPAHELAELERLRRERLGL